MDPSTETPNNEREPTKRRKPNGGTQGPRATAPTRVVVAPPNFQTIALQTRSLAPLMIHNFGKKARLKMIARHEAGSVAVKGKKKEKRDFDEDFNEARHISAEGWDGIPASAFRSACIDACRAVGFQMTRAKMSIFIEADGVDKTDGTPLVRIKGKGPTKDIRPARNDDGSIDLRARPFWPEWSITLRVRYDADQFSAEDVANLVERAGCQIGIGEGRPFSKNSHGMGFGMFTVRKG